MCTSAASKQSSTWLSRIGSAKSNAYYRCAFPDFCVRHDARRRAACLSVSLVRTKEMVRNTLKWFSEGDTENILNISNVLGYFACVLLQCHD